MKKKEVIDILDQYISIYNDLDVDTPAFINPFSFALGILEKVKEKITNLKE